MDWPAQSTDLNPIENLWDQIKTMVQEQNPTSVKELWTAINFAWESFPFDGLNNLIVSVSRRCAAVIEVRVYMCIYSSCISSTTDTYLQQQFDNKKQCYSNFFQF